jgi:hypothetical protein
MAQPPDTSQPPDSYGTDGTEAGVMNLQLVHFDQIQKEGPLAIYQALIQNPSEPGTEYSLTVTAASPAVGPETIALQEFLNTMKVAFLLLDAPVPEDPDTEEPGPFDPKNELLFEPGVVTLGREGPVGVAVAVETATGYDKPGFIKRTIKRVITVFYKTTVDPSGKDHRWTAKGKHPQQAEVTVTKGYGTVKAAKPRSQDVQVGPKYFATGKVVTVHGAVRMTYNLHGSFNPPPGVVVR